MTDRDDIALFTFTLDTDSSVTLRTYSYAGGQDAAGDIIPAGGFDPALAIFDEDAPQFLITMDDAMHCDDLNADPVTGLCLDSELADISLPAGTYLVSLTQSDHLPVGPTFADGFSPGTVFGPGEFVDFTGAVRTGNWELDILGVSSAAEVPEPGTAALVAAVLVVLFRTRRRPA